MAPIWFSHAKEIELLQHAWQTEFEKRASGGTLALAGFHYQFLVALHDTLRAWLDRSSPERSRPKVFTECLSDILDRSSNDIILVTQVKRTTRPDSFRDALTELWLIYHLATETSPNLVPYLRFRVLSSKSDVKDYERVLNQWYPSDQRSLSSAVGVFRERVTVQLFSDPQDEILGLLANNLRAQDPFGYVQRWLGILLAAAGKKGTTGFENAAHSIWNDLQSIENTSLAPSQSVYVWTSQDKGPSQIAEGDVLTGERPQVHHLRKGYFAFRSEVYQPIAESAQEWALDLSNNQDKQVRLPVFWISGRSGSGKSVALMHVLALLYESGLGPILWLGNKTELLRKAVPWALKLASKNRQVVIGIDDPYAPNTQGDDIVWMEVLATFEGIRQGGDASALPLIICCGPSEQAERMQKDLPEEVSLTLKELPEEERRDVLQLRSWYVRRTKKSPPRVGDENVLLVQLFFEWETGHALPEFASRFRNRIKEADPKGLLEDVVTRMLCVNRLYVGYPSKAIRAHLAPDLQDTFYRLREEHHIAQTIGDHGIGLWLAHPHLSNVIYESWYPLQNSRAVRADHLFRVIEDSAEYGSSASERMAPLWAISNATFSSTEQKPVVGRLDQRMILEVLPSVYESRTLDSGKRLALTELPVWIQIQAFSPGVALRPNPISEALDQVKVENLNQRGLRLTCHKLLQHHKSVPEHQRSNLIDSIVQLLTQAPSWHEWAPVADDAYRRTRDPRIVELIIDWVTAHPFSHWAATLFVPVLHNNPANPRVLNAARYLLPRVGGEFGWGDVAIQLLKFSGQSFPLSVLQWAKNNFREIGACFLLGRLLKRGQAWAEKWASEWCEIWHEERSANFVLEPLLDLTGPNEKIREWCIHWIIADHRTADTGFLVERMIQTFPSDGEVLSMGVHWLENNSIEHGSWQFVWGALFKVKRQDITTIPLWEPESNSEQNQDDKATRNPLLKLAESIPNTDPKGWYHLANGLRKAKRSEDALAALLQAIELDPQFVEAWRVLGVMYDRAGENELALEANLTLIGLRPDDSEAWHQLGLSYSKLGRFKEEATALVRATELDPGSAKYWQSLGATYNELGENELAVDAAQRVVALLPENAETWYRLSISYGKVGRTDDRVAALIKATELNPTLVEGWRALSAAQSRSGESGLAIQALRKAAELASNNAKSWYHLGIAYGLSGQYQDEAAALIRATELDPNHASAWQALGATYNHLGQYDLALEAATKFAGLRPDDAEAFYRLGVAYGKVGRLEDKSAALRTASNIDPNLIRVYRAMSDVPYGPSEINQLVLEASLRHVELQPDNAEAWYNLGISYGKLGRYQDESVALAKATELDPAFADAWLAAGATYNELGQNELALNSSLKLTELRSDDAEAWYWLGVTYGKLNRHSDKALALEKALELKPDLAEALQALGATYNHLSLYDEGLAVARRLTELTPDDANAWYYLGLAYGKLGRYQDEVTALVRATELDPNSAHGWQALGATHNLLEQRDLALAAAIRVTELLSDDADAWYRLGLSYSKMKRFEDASTALSKASELDPTMADAHKRLSEVNAVLEGATLPSGLDTEGARQWYDLGVSYLRTDNLAQTTRAFRQASKLATDERAAVGTIVRLQMISATMAYRDGCYAEAIKLCKAIIGIDPTVYEVWRILSSSYRRQNNYEDALDSAKHLVRISSNNAEAWYILGLRYGKVGQVNEATSAFKQALQLDNNFTAPRRALDRLSGETDLRG
jgi:tetratricopeptide (TPR) repeat protein